MTIRNELLANVLTAYGGTPSIGDSRNAILEKILIAIGGTPTNPNIMNVLLYDITTQLGGVVINPNNRNSLLRDIVLAAGGVITDPNIRNSLIIDWILASSSCNFYTFKSTDTDSLQLGSAFTGNLKVQIKAPSETGLHPDIIAGRQGAFVADTWVQYEIEAVALTYIVDATFNGRVAYAKDNVWFNIDMGVAVPSELWGTALSLGGQWVDNLDGSYNCNSSQISNLTGANTLANGVAHTFKVKLEFSTGGFPTIVNGGALSVGFNEQTIFPSIASAIVSAGTGVSCRISGVSVTEDVIDQEIPNSNGDYIESPRSANWSKGECVPEWQRTHTEQHTEQYT